MWQRRRDHERDSVLRRAQWALLGAGVVLSIAAVCATLKHPPSRSPEPSRGGSLAAGGRAAVPPPESSRATAVPPRRVDAEQASGEGSRPAPSGSARVWTLGVSSVERGGMPVLLDDVRAAKNDGFDRVVFEFRDAIPGYHVEYIDQPVRDCGAGEVRTIAGDGWLQVRFSPAVAHTEAGEPTITERERALALPILRELELTCDFEAVVTWVLGAASPHRYSLLELRDPPRLVVDIEH